MSDIELSQFLRKIANDLDAEKLSSLQKETIANFFLEFVANQAQENQRIETQPLVFSDSDIKKFLNLGWYVYTYLLVKDSDPKLKL